MCAARRVLVVEDHPALRGLLETALAEEGFVVVAAADGAAALAALPDADPCVILLDLHMPVLDGDGFARAYHAQPRADAAIIAMSAAPVAGSLAAIRPAAVVAKPYDLDQLLAAVAHWVGRHVPRAG